MSNPIEEGEQKVEKLIKSEPWYVWAGAAGAAGVVFFFIWKRRQAAASASTTQNNTDTTPPATDPTALTGYSMSNGPTSNYPELQSGTSTVPVVPFGMTPIYDSNGNLVGWQEPNPVQSPAPAPKPTPTPAPPSGGPVRNPGPPPHPVGQKIYTVVGGDTLSGIMKKLGLHSGWQALYNKNRAEIGPDPNLIHAGERLNYTGIGDGGTYEGGGSIEGGHVGGGSMEGGHVGGGSIEGSHVGGGFHLAINAGRNTIDQWAFSQGMHTDFDSKSAVGE